MANLNETYEDPKKLANDYVHEVYSLIKKRNPGEVEFLQATREIFDSLTSRIFKKSAIYSDGIFGKNY